MKKEDAVVIDCNNLDFRQLFISQELVFVGCGFGITETKGRLLQAWEKGTPIVLKNYSTIKVGTDCPTFLKFFSGELDQLIIDAPLKTFTYELRAQDRKPDFRITILPGPNSP